LIYTDAPVAAVDAAVIAADEDCDDEKDPNVDVANGVCDVEFTEVEVSVARNTSPVGFNTRFPN